MPGGLGAESPGSLAAVVDLEPKIIPELSRVGLDLQCLIPVGIEVPSRVARFVVVSHAADGTPMVRQVWRGWFGQDDTPNDQLKRGNPRHRAGGPLDFRLPRSKSSWSV